MSDIADGIVCYAACVVYMVCSSLALCVLTFDVLTLLLRSQLYRL